MKMKKNFVSEFFSEPVFELEKEVFPLFLQKGWSDWAQHFFPSIWIEFQWFAFPI
jgi:hypothetical protein